MPRGAALPGLALGLLCVSNLLNGERGSGKRSSCNCRLQIADCRLQIADCRVRITNLRNLRNLWIIPITWFRTAACRSECNRQCKFPASRPVQHHFSFSQYRIADLLSCKRGRLFLSVRASLTLPITLFGVCPPKDLTQPPSTYFAAALGLPRRNMPRDLAGAGL
jgi:hypothetical protein